jgi:hypothetical protein
VTVIWFLWFLGCGSPEVLLDCDEPEAGDLEGYCVLGENDGAAAAAVDLADCPESPSAPLPVAHGPGGCDEPSQAVLDAEQGAYEDCWRTAYEQALASLVHSADTGCVPTDAD